MDKFEVRDIENCYVCSEYMGPFKNELTVVTGYSERPVSNILGKNFITKETRDVYICHVSS